MWKIIGSRFANLFKSKTLSILDAVENPVEMYELAVQESELNIQNLIKAIAVALADQKNRERELQQALLESESWKAKAKTALEQSHGELARSALGRKAIAEQKVEEYTALNNALKTKIDEQRKQLERFKVKHEELKAKKSIYAAKFQTAKAQKQLSESLGGLNQTALSSVVRLEEKINKLEAESEALFELTSSQSELDTKLEELQINSKVDKELKKLQSEIAEAQEARKNQKLKAIEQQLNDHLTKVDKNVDQRLNDFYNKPKPPSLPPNGKDIMDNFFRK